MNIVVLDTETMGKDLNFEILKEFGSVTEFDMTEKKDVSDRIEYADIVIVNKIKLDEENLARANKLKLICVFATGYDNINIEYCRSKNIAVCNVCGYSTDSVSQLTMAMVLTLSTHITEYSNTVKNSVYTENGLPNCITPVFRELSGKTWGIVGLGNIGKKVAEIASAFGCKIIVNKQTPVDNFKCVDIDTLCRESDIISVHTPLTEKTKNLINRERIALMKKNAVFINVARGAIVDENAIVKALKEKRIGALGLDVYTKEPFEKDSVLNEIKNFDNVCMTPHMAWAAFEARERCLDEIKKNIDSFIRGKLRNRIDVK